MSPEDYALKLDDVGAACRVEGRDPKTFALTVGLYATVGRDEAEARGAFERGRASFPGGSMDAETWESWRADTLSGSPDQVRERIARFEALGVRELIVSSGVLPFALVEPEQLEILADIVIGSTRAVP
jgi:alkanesulfonate monooxygenase SsuD/methylene tetrahydromethanopterin reductase-like flavin-dependent oxidoreductase (luciferase family)